MAAGLEVDQLAYDYRSKPVVFIEHGLTGPRRSRYDAARGSGTNLYPMVIADSGHQYADRAKSGTDYYEYYQGMVDAELLRPPGAEVAAQYTIDSGRYTVKVNVKNLSGTTLSSSNSATVGLIVYEDAIIGVTSRYAQAVVQQSISTPLANNETREFTLQTADLTGFIFDYLHVIAFVDYRPGGSGAYDMLQAAVATSGEPLVISPESMLFMIDNASPANQSIPLSISGGEAGLTWEVASKPAWITVTPATGDTGDPVQVTALASSLAPGTVEGTVTLRFHASTGSEDRTIAVKAYRGAIWKQYLPALLR